MANNGEVTASQKGQVNHTRKAQRNRNYMKQHVLKMLPCSCLPDLEPSPHRNAAQSVPIASTVREALDAGGRRRAY